MTLPSLSFSHDVEVQKENGFEDKLAIRLISLNDFSPELLDFHHFPIKDGVMYPAWYKKIKSEKTSTTAATPPFIDSPTLEDDSEITIDIDQVGSTTAGKGLKVVIIGRRVLT